MPLRLVYSNVLSAKRFSATFSTVKSLGAVCQEIRKAAGLTQREVAEAGDLDQSRVSEIERGRYVPGLDLGRRLAKGLGVSLTEIVARWEGLHTEVFAGGVRVRGVRGRMPTAPLDVPQVDLFRRVRGLWELMSPERREQYWRHGRSLVAGQWKEEARTELPRSEAPLPRSRPHQSRRAG